MESSLSFYFLACLPFPVGIKDDHLGLGIFLLPRIDLGFDLLITDEICT
jgi:hypothetical protein